MSELNNKYFEKFLKTNHERKVIFDEILNLFGNKPIRILEIGTTRDTAVESIYGDGWSTFSWLSYLIPRGGHLKIVDLSQQSLDNCKMMLGDYVSLLEGEIEFVCDEGVNHIDDSYDLIYLDGGDDPNEMVQELRKIDRKKSVVLCDDFASKGTLTQIEFPDFVEMKCAGGHLMAYYPKL